MGTYKEEMGMKVELSWQIATLIIRIEAGISPETEGDV